MPDSSDPARKPSETGVPKRSLDARWRGIIMRRTQGAHGEGARPMKNETKATMTTKPEHHESTIQHCSLRRRRKSDTADCTLLFAASLRHGVGPPTDQTSNFTSSSLDTVRARDSTGTDGRVPLTSPVLYVRTCSAYQSVIHPSTAKALSPKIAPPGLIRHLHGCVVLASMHDA